MPSFRPTEDIALNHVRIELAPRPAKKRWFARLADAVKEQAAIDAQHVRDVEYRDYVRGKKIEWSE